MNEKRFKCNLNAKASEIKKKNFQMIAQHSFFDEKKNKTACDQAGDVNVR